MNIYDRINLLHSKSARRDAWAVWKAEMKWREKWKTRKENAAKQIALLRRYPIWTYSKAEEDAAMQWLLNDGWTAEEIDAKLNPPVKTDAEEMQELIEIVLHESDETIP